MKIKFILPLFILGLANIVYGQSDYKNLKVLDPKIEESELKLLERLRERLGSEVCLLSRSRCLS